MGKLNQKKISNIIILLLCLYQLPYAQYNKLNFENYTTKDGLSDNYINFVKQDYKGWIWIGTGMGIERFDGIKFKTYSIYENDSIILKDVLTRNLFESSNHTLYLCIEEMGLAIYNRAKDRFQRIKINNENILTNVSVKDIVEDSQGNIWAATKKGICKIDFSRQNVKYYQHKTNNKNSITDNYVRKLIFDENKNLWIGTQKGLDMMDVKNELFYHFADTNNIFKNDILEIINANQNSIWVGTVNNGIIIIDNTNFKFSNLILDKNNPRSVKVNCILKENENKFWIGTRGGLYIYDPVKNNKTCIQNDIHENNSLIHNSVIDIFKDKKGDLWVATRRGLSYLVMEKQVFNNLLAFPDNNKYLNNGELYCIWISDDDNVWMGTESGGVNIFNRKTGTLKYLTEENGLSNNCVKSILSVDNKNILIGTFQGGLNIYNKYTGAIKIIKVNNIPNKSISDNIIWDMAIDKNNNVWIGTASGLDKYNPKTGIIENISDFSSLSNGVTWIEIDNDNDIWLGGEITHIYRPGLGIVKTFLEKTRSLYVDKHGNNWLLTNDHGIAKYDKKNGIITHYNENDGLSCNLTLQMQEDKQGKLWISTAKGLSCFNPNDETFKNYFLMDGIQGDQFNYGAAAQSKQGDLFFGGENGMTYFNPDQIIENNFIPPIYITDLKILNKSVKVDDENLNILSKSILETDTLKIPFKYNVLTLEFTTLNYTNSSRNQFMYKMEGFDNNWIETTDSRSATYTNLNPGKYVFKVIASNDNGQWNNNATSKIIYILPPFYKTIGFKILFIITILGSISLIFLFIFKRRELKKNYEFDILKSQKLHELNTFKLQLFTNISHEIKTPLTLIITPLTKILKKKIEDPEISEGLHLMQKNANQLMKLVTQLLDFRKLQAGKLTIDLKRGDIVNFTRNIFLSFDNLLKEKELTHHFESVQSKIVTSFDPDKLRNILNNLISNAIKYNKPGGDVTFNISLVIEQSNGNNTRFIKMEVNDTGVGINDKDLPNIYTRFFSKTPSIDVNSSGIGLALVKELIELHDGIVSVDSKEGIGTTFTVLLPYIELAEDISSTNSGEDVSTTEYINSKKFQQDQKNNSIILVVEDNKDVQQYLKSQFSNQYLVLVANDGKEGLDVAIKTLPDIIISDIMMPLMDGKELCRKLKNDERTSHIPVLLLTALSSKENVKEGLKLGADDYITKPFDFDLIQTKIDNLLSMRKSLREKYSKQLSIEPSQVEVKTLDEKFLEKAIKITEQNIDNPELNIEAFIEQMGVSRMQLYRKISALTNMTVKELINDIRLKRAKQMLTDKKITVSEVAYGVGFNDLSYFGKCFKKKYGMSPSEYNLQNRKKEGE